MKRRRSVRRRLTYMVPSDDVKLLVSAIVMRSDGYCTGDKATDEAIKKFFKRHPKLICGQPPEFDL